MSLRQRKVSFPPESSDQNDQKKSVQPDENVPPKLKVWVLASRPKTLTASVAPVIVATSLVKALGKNSAEGIHHESCLFALFACLVQLGTNLHNDYADFVKGADDEKRGEIEATSIMKDKKFAIKQTSFQSWTS